MGLEVRNPTRDELEQAWQLDRIAFDTPESRRDDWLASADPERMCAVFDGTRLLAMASALPSGQFFGGRRVAMGALSSVAVAPEARGHGHASRAVWAVTTAMRERGEVVSALFPGTTQLYRRLGWELAGAFVARRLSASALQTLPRTPSGRLRRAEPDDLPAIRRCYDQLAPRINGFLDRAAWNWAGYERHWSAMHRYVALDPGGRIRGFISFEHAPARRPGSTYSIRVRDHFALDAESNIALWRMLGSSATQADGVVYASPVEDPLFLLLPEQGSRVVIDVRWMLRVNDPVGAVAARGFPHGLDLEVPLQLHSPPDRSAGEESSQNFVLQVARSRGHLEAGGGGGVRMGIGAFASLYSGWAQTATLARAGLLEGGDANERALLDAAFAGPTPWLPEEF